ncbi:hypothetical protein N0V90_000479 [Kalmusia sp. IMI 367209]|nr:hypothetical protein N0V90_000479 [Kalmusia sp. IMI 367209]
MAYPLTSATLIHIILFLTFIFVRRRRRTPNFPPGPPPLPLLGNLHQLPTKKTFLKFTQWSKDYASPIIGLRLGHRQHAIVLNTWRSVRDLFDQRGATYSSRPDIPLVPYVVPGYYHVAFMKHDRVWRRGRAAITSFLSHEEMGRVLPIQEAETSMMVWEVLQRPEEYGKHVMRAFCGVILASVYGVRGTRELTERFFRIQDEWAGMLDMGAFPPLDVWPWLKYVPDFLTPWLGWRRKSRELGKAQKGFYDEMFAVGRRRVKEGAAEDSFLKKLVERREKEGFTDVELVYIAGFLIEAGADTTANGLLTFILAMAAHPEIQKVAQDEVDSVFKNEMPKDIDAAKLPYLQAVFFEALRWRPSFPLSIPHATSKDDTYNGFFVPANTTVIMNTWAIHHNEDDYPNPDVFDPTRFLDNDFGTVLASEDGKDASRRRTYAFGAGRRVCAGQDMAEKSLLMAMAKLLWAFNIRPNNGSLLDTSVTTAFTDAVLTGPKEADIGFKVRSEARNEVIYREREKAEEVLRRFE